MKGYDHGYLLYPGLSSAEDPAARLWSDDGKVQMEVYTTAPAIQLYTGNVLAPARQGSEYLTTAGGGLESEFLPDSPNHPEWPHPACWLQPSEAYDSQTRYRFLAL